MEQKTKFEAVISEYCVIVERYIHFRIPNSFDAEDVIQETYFAAYVGFSKLKNPALAKSWLLSIAKNQCNMWYRKQYGMEKAELKSIPSRTKVSENEQEALLRSILGELSKESAKVLCLTMEGYKQREIADSLGIPVGTVKSRLYYAKKQFRQACTPMQLLEFEKGRKRMAKPDYTCGFPMQMPALEMKESAKLFMKIKCEEEYFIIPCIGNKNAEGIYRYPDRKLAMVSTYSVPKAAIVHDAAGVKVCRDIYNVRTGKFYEKEATWFMQLTEEYIRDLGTILCDSKADEEAPTTIVTFLEEDYDIMVNGKDRIHGRPLLIQENPPVIRDGRIYAEEYNVRYTMGCFDVTIGARTFETIKFIRVQNDVCVTENYVDKNGRLVLLRSYEAVNYLKQREENRELFLEKTDDIPVLVVNDIEYRLVEDSINRYAL